MSLRILSGVVGGLTLLAGAVAIAAAPPPIEAFGNLPAITTPEISPNGELLVWGDNRGAVQKIVIYDLKAGVVKRSADVPPEVRLRRVAWVDDATFLAIAGEISPPTDWGRVRFELLRTYAADVAGGDTRQFVWNRGYGAPLIAPRTARPKTVVMTAPAPLEDLPPGRQINRDDPTFVSAWNLYEVDTTTGEDREAQRGTRYTQDWVVNAQGRCIARGDWDKGNRVYRVLTADQAGHWKEIYRRDRSGALDLYGLTPDETAIIAADRPGPDPAQLWSIPLDGSGARAFAGDAGLDDDDVLKDGYSRNVIAVRMSGAGETLHWLDAHAKTRYEVLQRAFPGRDLLVTSHSADQSRALVRVRARGEPTTYYVVNFGTGKADLAGEEYPAFANVPLGTVRPTSYPTRDRAKIPAYVTFPPGFQAETQRLPLIVLPHDGPEARDAPAFDWLVQFLASRGYIVFQPQFRGSTGLGDAHRRAGYGEWGGVMQDDITDGVKALASQAYVDRRRICIVGIGYGGYAALAGATLTPELYACAASINGIGDLRDQLTHVSRVWGSESDTLVHWRQQIGPVVGPRILQRSPALNAQAVRAPILLIHASDDQDIPVSQSEGMARALARADKLHTFVTLEGEDHWLSRSASRIQVLGELERFLAASFAGVASD